MREPSLYTIQPLRWVLHSDTTMMVVDDDGWVQRGRDGLYDFDTRYLSVYQATFEDFTPIFLSGERLTSDSAILTYTNPTFRAGRVIVEESSLFLRIARVVDRGVHETLELTSYVCEPISFRLLINLEPSFDDIFEVRDLRRAPPRPLHRQFSTSTGVLSFSYRDSWFERALHCHVVSSTGLPVYSPNLLIFRVRLTHHQTWHARIDARTTGAPLGNSARCCSKGQHPRSGNVSDDAAPVGPLTRLAEQSQRQVEAWSEGIARVESSNVVVQRVYEQAVRDLASLRIEQVANGWYPAAGVPWYNAIFGRDALITAIQCLPIGCPFPAPVLVRLAQLQGTRVNTRNDEEPGKIPHELRVGQLSTMGKVPFDPFYGTVDASLLYVILLAETYRFTGDRKLLDQHVETMDACLRWAAEYGDVDGDGFVEYWMRRPDDYHNQAWKDAGDAVVYPDGRVVPDPIAIVEVQGYYYDALCCAAEIYRVVGRDDDATRARARAERLRSDFDERYWLPGEGFYAFGLDPSKQPIHSIASNPGQLLWSRIVPSERVPRLAARLFEDDMFSGWGIRTLSNRHAAYDAMSYQRGSVWPHDNAIIALGLKRHGHWQATNRIAEGIFAAGGYFSHAQLPELWAGLDRAATIWPVPYPWANVPQAWAAGSVPMLLRAILGIEPDLAHRRLLVDPTLPEWLDQITIRGLRFLGKTVDLRFNGAGRSSRVDVLQCPADVAVEQVPHHGSVAE